MTEASTAQAAPAAVTVTPVSLAEKRAQAEPLLTEILKHMEYPARLDWKEMPDGGLGVAVHFEGELPGITPGKRSYLLDCLQFLVNKVVNRPNTEKRWVSLGANAFPEPRPERGARAPQVPAGANGAAPQGGRAAVTTPPGAKDAVVKSSAGTPRAMRQQPPAGQQSSAPQQAPHSSAPQQAPNAAASPQAPQQTPKSGASPQAPQQQARGQEKRPPPQRSGQPDERTLEVTEDAALSAAVKALAEKCSKVGRTYALVMLTADDRARVLKAAEGIAGLKTKTEGEGVLRRVVFTPDKPAPLPKRTALPDDEDDEE